MRIAQHEKPGLVRDGRFKGVKIDAVLSIRRAHQGNINSLHARVFWRGQEGRVNGRLHQRLTAVFAEKVRNDVQTGHDARKENQVVGIDLPAVQIGQPVDQDGFKAAVLVGIAKYSALHLLLQRANHDIRGAEIHVSYPHGQHIRSVHMPFHAQAVFSVWENIKTRVHNLLNEIFWLDYTCNQSDSETQCWYTLPIL